MLRGVLWIAAIAMALVALHHLALWAERRGWIFYKHRKASPGTAGRAFLQVQSLLEPGRQHVVESRQDEHSEEDASGEPPSSGAPTMTAHTEATHPSPDLPRRTS